MGEPVAHRTWHLISSRNWAKLSSGDLGHSTNTQRKRRPLGSGDFSQGLSRHPNLHLAEKVRNGSGGVTEFSKSRSKRTEGHLAYN